MPDLFTNDLRSADDLGRFVASVGSDVAGLRNLEVRRGDWQEPTTGAQVGRLEEGLHEALERWARDHALRYPQVGVLEYEPLRYVAQQIGTAVTPAAIVRPGYETLRKLYLCSAGAVAEQTLAAFEQTTAASRGSIRSIGDQVRGSVERGGRVAVLCAHVEGLDDVAVFAGALAVAMHGSSAAARSGLILNKVMSRETFGGVPVVELLGAFANIHWVIPASESMRRWGISERALRYVNSLGIRALLAAMRDGAAVTFAPAGSAMIPAVDDNGNLTGLRFPAVGPATSKLLSRFDSYVLAACVGGRVRVSELRPIEMAVASARADGPPRLMNGVLAQLGDIVAALAGVPVEAA